MHILSTLNYESKTEIAGVFQANYQQLRVRNHLNSLMTLNIFYAALLLCYIHHMLYIKIATKQHVFFPNILKILSTQNVFAEIISYSPKILAFNVFHYTVWFGDFLKYGNY